MSDFLLIFATSLAVIGSVLDNHSTYYGIKNSGNTDDEGNILFRYIFKYLGIYGGIIINILLTAYIFYKIFSSETLTYNSLIFILLFLGITRIAVALGNYKRKHNWIGKFIIYAVPLNWNWKKIIKKIRGSFN